jgi:acyl-CoA thioesterase
MLFSQTLASMIERTDGEPGFSAEVGADWAQGRASFGGIVAAFGNEAMRRIVPADRLLRALDVTFVGPVFPGPIHLTSEILRVGRAVTIASSRLLSQDQVAATVTGVYGAARQSALIIAPAAGAETASPDSLPTVRLPISASAPQFLQHFELRWAEGSHRPFTGLSMTRSKAYIRHRDPCALTESHVVALIDCIFSPALQPLKAVAQSSSLNWRLEFIRHDYSFAPDAWWRIDTQTNAAAEGYISHSSVVLDPNGTPAAFSHQLVAVFG